MLLSSVALAQELPCAKLLENLPSSSLEGISTFEATLTTRYLESGEAEVQSYLAKDFVNKRSYHSFSEKIGDDFVTTAIYRYQDGVGTLTRGEKTEEAPPEETIETIEELLEMLEFDLRNYQNLKLESCDGLQRWADELGGEQVTLSTDVATPNGTTELLFNDLGQLLAIQLTYPAEPALSRPEEIAILTLNDLVVEEGLLVKGILSQYELVAGKLVLREERRLEVQSYNQPLDESLFEE